MCSIIAWSGRVPQGLLTSLLLRGAKRGLDSTGVAFRGVSASNGKPTNYCYRIDEPAELFVRNNEKALGDARMSLRGICHTRNASPGMPVNPENAHPFLFAKMFYAHNGSIRNWTELRESTSAWLADRQAKAEQAYEEAKASGIQGEPLEALFAGITSAKDALIEWNTRVNALNTHTRASGCTTDSMVLGPYIHARDFSTVKGCMALVWLHRNNVYTFRYGKEAVWSKLTWAPSSSAEVGDVETVTLVASTAEMIKGALSKLKNVNFAFTEPEEFDEDTVYKVTPCGLENEGTVPVNERIEDQFSSSTVQRAPAVPLECE